MAEAVPYKLYRATENDRYDLIPDLQATNSTYAAGQNQEGTVDQFMQDYNANKAYYDDYFARNTTPGVKEAFQQIISGGAATQPIQSGYVMDNGVLTTQKAIDEQAAQKAGIADGSLVEVAPGMTVPKGSAGEANLPNIGTNNTANAANAATQQQAAQPAQQQPVTLQDVYNSRPDLQELYNQDGTAKNVNDPRVAGIPTLSDWAQKYGTNEVANLSLNQPAPAAGASTTTPAGQAPASSTAKPLPSTTNPIEYVDNLYKQVYEKLGISSLKEQVEKYNKEFLALRNEKSDKAAKISDNPWFTEGIRIRELKKLDDSYEQKEANLQGYLQLANGLYNQGLSQANAMISDVNQIAAENRQHDQELADARYKLANSYEFYKFPGSPLVYSTASGDGISYDQYIAMGGDPNFSNIFEIKPQGVNDERTLVLDIAKKYPDAGILPSDSLLVAQEKQKNSAIYQKAVLIKKPSVDGSPRTTPPTPANPQPSTNPAITLTAVPKTTSADNIRRWLAANWHTYASRKPYYDVWGTAAEALRQQGIDPAKYDKTFWDVFRPGEYDQYHQKTTSSTSTITNPFVKQ